MMMRNAAWAALLLLPAATTADTDWETDPFEQAAAVNEGPLEVLETPPDRPAHHHVNRLTITPESIAGGWVLMDQCHYDIDPVPLAEIVYTEGRIRGLAITRATNIGTATAGENSVRLENVEKQAALCVSGETRALERRADTLMLRNGPFMRRFLDGYYPMHVTLDIRYPPGLELLDRFPAPAPGIRYDIRPGEILLDIWFEGILETRFLFRNPATP